MAEKTKLTGQQIMTAHDQQLRFLFEKGISGHRFEPAFTMTVTAEPELTEQQLNQRLGNWLGPHNIGSYVFRDSSGRVEGIRLACQCETCLLAQIDFCLRFQANILANGLG